MGRAAFWNRQTIAYAAFLFRRRNGRYPTNSNWSVGSEDNPTPGTVYSHYESWQEMLAEADRIDEKCAVT